MSIKQGPEAVVQSVVATLAAHVNEAVDIIAAQWADATPLPHIKSGNCYAFMQPIVPEYPAIIVNSLEGREVTDAAPVWAEVDHRLDVTVIVQGDDRSIDRQTLRYLWAIWRTIHVYQALDGTLSGLAGVDVVRYGRSATYREGKNPLMLQMGGVEIAVHVEETVP